MKWFTSDLHHMHKRIVDLTDRNRDTTKEDHTQWLISLWNQQVKKGDLSFSNDYEEVASFLSQLNGQKILIKGNHDQRELLNRLQKEGLIATWKDYMEVKIGGVKACLFHFPIYSWNGQHRGTFHLHGHTHGQQTNLSGYILDVGIDAAYKILGRHRFFSEKDVVEYMDSRSIHVVDNHRK